MTWVWIIIAIVLVAGVWFLMRGKKKEESIEKKEENIEPPVNPTL